MIFLLLDYDADVQKAEGDDLVPFHKLSQWLGYSLIEALERTLNWRLEGKEYMTGLPEYRNGLFLSASQILVNAGIGGLLVDFGVLELKPNLLPTDPKSGLPHALPSHPAVVEWRALTVVGL